MRAQPSGSPPIPCGLLHNQRIHDMSRTYYNLDTQREPPHHESSDACEYRSQDASHSQSGLLEPRILLAQYMITYPCCKISDINTVTWFLAQSSSSKTSKPPARRTSVALHATRYVHWLPCRDWHLSVNGDLSTIDTSNTLAEIRHVPWSHLQWPIVFIRSRRTDGKLAV